jgi:hypothetical protein
MEFSFPRAGVQWKHSSGDNPADHPDLAEEAQQTCREEQLQGDDA